MAVTAIAAARAGRYEEARAELRLALRRRPGLEPARRLLARLRGAD